jgi:hypothetical protein
MVIPYSALKPLVMILNSWMPSRPRVVPAIEVGFQPTGFTIEVPSNKKLLAMMGAPLLL